MSGIVYAILVLPQVLRMGGKTKIPREVTRNFATEKKLARLEGLEPPTLSSED